MSNETKRNVFEVALNHATKTGWVDYGQLLDRYNAALPDDMPVIPKAVSDVLVELKRKKFALYASMAYVKVVSLSSWMTFEHEEAFARAWVLGVWRVEGTGEIVKLEEDK